MDQRAASDAVHRKAEARLSLVTVSRSRFSDSGVCQVSGIASGMRWPVNLCASASRGALGKLTWQETLDGFGVMTALRTSDGEQVGSTTSMAARSSARAVAQISSGAGTREAGQPFLV
ncbi:hypothetical protein [Streptomyces sp. NPDC005498]|uniref:hypothetical protein n=1 Tax=Streptomyces sp. NPDC005498 TaxID=3364717 RepID=UPI0036797B6C